MLVEAVAVRKVESCSHQESSEHVSHVSCGDDWHEVRRVRHVLLDFKDLRIALKQEHAKTDETCKLAEGLKVLSFDVQYSIDMI